MLDSIKPDDIYLALFFVVPGIITLFVRSRFITGRTPSIKENVFAFFVLSLIYYSFTILFIEQALAVREPWLLRAAIWIALVLIGPAVFGLILGIAAQKEWIHRVADNFDLSIVHVIPTAWDWRFCKMPRDGLFVMVTLTNGATVAGHFGSMSFASSDTGERDLYIQEEYTITADDRWEARPEKVGILIPAREIRHVEFWQPANE
jgi:Family of unknown function (DUF6338)